MVVPRERPPLWPLEGWRRGVEEGTVSVIAFVYRYSDLHSLRLSTPVEGGGRVLQPCPVLHVWRRYNSKPPPTTSGQRLPVDLARSVPTALLSRVSVR